MHGSQRKLAEIIHLWCPEEGLYETPVPGVHCIKFSQPYAPVKRTWSASLSIAVQGSKEINLGGESYRGEPADYVVTLIDLPVTSQVAAASPQDPFLCIKIDMDPRVLSEVAAQLELDDPREIENPSGAIFIGKASEKMMEAAVRLGELFHNADDASVLGPLIVREMLYHLLKGQDGTAIRQFVRAGSNRHKISQAIYAMKAELNVEVDVAAMAKTANMSRSAFFKHFKEVTAMSPIQYQKRLRLLEARRLMTDEGETAERSAFAVGYNSASQFSREYSRMFGDAPQRNVLKIKEAGEAIHQI